MHPWQQQEAQQIEHLVMLAQQPGWWAYVEHRVRQLEASAGETSPPMFVGLEQQVANRLKELGFKRPRRYPGR